MFYRDEKKSKKPWDHNDINLTCQAFLQGIYGRKYVWLLPGWYSDRWWENSADTSCTKHDIKLAAGNYLATRPLPVGDSTTPTIAGKVSDGFPPLEVKRNGLGFRIGVNLGLELGYEIRLSVTKTTTTTTKTLRSNESTLLS